MGTKRLDRLGDLVRHQLLARFTCPNPNCGRSALYDPSGLIGFIGREKPLGQVRGRCHRCGSVVQGVTPAERPWVNERMPRILPVPVALAEARQERPKREPVPPSPTLAQARRMTSWLWWYCVAYLPGGGPCGHSGAIALMPYILLWGADASSDRLRDSLSCPVCHSIGGQLSMPSVDRNSVDGYQPFPADRVISPGTFSRVPIISEN